MHVAQAIKREGLDLSSQALFASTILAARERLTISDHDLGDVPEAVQPEDHFRLLNQVQELTVSMQDRRSFMNLPLVPAAVRMFATLRRTPIVYLLNEGAPWTRGPEIRGGKGSGLAELVALGMPVPPGATITTQVSQNYMQTGRVPTNLSLQLGAALRRIERQSGLIFGSASQPLLVSVRSGARVSMPGMMDTVLNVGLNDETVGGLARRAGDRFAWDSYRRFLSMFATTVMGVDRRPFDSRLQRAKQEAGVSLDCELPVDHLIELCASYKLVVETACRRPLPSDPMEQLTMAIFAVLGSWNSERCIAYRKSENIPDHWGTAVNIQAMVFGNLGQDSGTGVVFSRNPATGEPGLYGEYLANAQGEDVVAGVRTPESIWSLDRQMPAVYDQLATMVQKLEEHFGDMMDVEFTVEAGKLYLLQCRAAKRTTEAAAVFAVDQVGCKRWTIAQALKSVKVDFSKLLRQSFDPSALEAASKDSNRLLFSGQGASPGAVTGNLACTCEQAKAMSAANLPVILFRPDTSPDDLPGMLVSRAIVTATGGTTSHAAVVARGKGIPAVVGCPFTVSADGMRILADDFSINSGELVSVDGASGLVILSDLPLVDQDLSEAMATLVQWKAELGDVAEPAPIDGSSYGNTYSLNNWLVDFYLTNLMAEKARDTELEQRAVQLRNQIEEQLASIFTAYLAYAVASEVVFYNSECGGYFAVGAWKRLQDKYGLGKRKGDYCLRRFVQDLAGRPLKDQVEYFQLCQEVFEDRHWCSSFGGPRWATIARTPKEYLTGEMPRSVYVDRVFDLQHNGGYMFNKHGMVSSRTDENTLHVQLNDKKKLSSVGELKVKLLAHGQIAPQVLELYQAGLNLSIWEEPVAPAAPPNGASVAHRSNRRCATSLASSRADRAMPGITRDTRLAV